VRANTARALGQLGDSRAIAPLVKALQDESNEVRYFAAEALGNIGDIQALPYLEKVMLEDKGEFLGSNKVADVAAQAIEPVVLLTYRLPQKWLNSLKFALKK